MSYKLYTKTGDKGLTNLYDMRRIGKHETIFDVLGNLDELSCYIGKLLVEENEKEPFLRQIQSLILDISSDIATTTKRDNLITVTEEDIKYIEKKIDFYHSKCPPLKEFILMGINNREVTAHLCRTLCRRSERSLWKLYNQYVENQDQCHISNDVFIYINRLSDFFFAYARYLSDGQEYTRSQVKNIL